METMKHLWTSALLACSAISMQAMAHEPGAHVHGVATLQVTLEQDSLTFALESPLANLLGFEHAPRNDKQKQAVQRMADTLRHPETLFAMPSAAQCAPGPVQLESSALQLGVDGKGDAAQDDGHADIDADMSFRCRVPAALTSFDVKLFDAFPGIRQLNVQMVGPHGQSAATLTAKQRRFSW
jgi:hypothetical protein